MSEKNDDGINRTRLIVDLAINKTLDKYLKKIDEKTIHYMIVTLKLKSEPHPIDIKNALRISGDKQSITIEYFIDKQPKKYHESMENIEWYNAECG